MKMWSPLQAQILTVGMRIAISIVKSGEEYNHKEYLFNNYTDIIFRDLGWHCKKVEDNIFIVNHKYETEKNGEKEGFNWIYDVHLSLRKYRKIWGTDALDNLCSYNEKYGYEYFGDVYLYGDLNNDDVINIQDIVLIVNIVLGVDEYDYNADMNQDGIINVMDIVILINFVLDD